MNAGRESRGPRRQPLGLSSALEAERDPQGALRRGSKMWRKGSAPTTRAWCALVALALASAQGCVARLGQGQSCNRNSDCVDRASCVSGRCALACVSDRDCPLGGSLRCLTDPTTSVQACLDPALLLDASPEGATPAEASLEAEASAPPDAAMDASPPDAALDATPLDAEASAPDAASDAPASEPAPRCPSGMVYVPEGTFLMGSTAGDGGANESPQHSVSLSAYCLDRVEVNATQYEQCLTAGRCTRTVAGVACNAGVATRALHPANCVTWAQADSYCAWVGSRLPTEAEWEYAARSPDGRVYPWGNTSPGAEPCWSGGGTPRTLTCATGAFTRDQSPAGFFDLAGNVSEWVQDLFGAYPSGPVSNPTGPASGSERVLRGGSYLVDSTASDPLRAAYRASALPTAARSTYGFRCARAPLF